MENVKAVNELTHTAYCGAELAVHATHAETAALIGTRAIAAVENVGIGFAWGKAFVSGFRYLDHDISGIHATINSIVGFAGVLVPGWGTALAIGWGFVDAMWGEQIFHDHP